MAKVNIDAYRVAGRPFRVAIEENATIGAVVGSNLTLSTSVTLLSGQVLPSGYVVQATDILNGLIAPADGQGTPSDWNQLTNVPANVQQVAALSGVGLVTRQTGGGWTVRQLTADPGVTISNSNGDGGNPTIGHADTSSVANFSSDNSNGVVLQDIAVTFDTFGHVQTITAGTVDLDARYGSALATGGTTAQFWRGDKAWANDLAGVSASALFGLDGAAADSDGTVQATLSAKSTSNLAGATEKRIAGFNFALQGGTATDRGGRASLFTKADNSDTLSNVMHWTQDQNCGVRTLSFGSGVGVIGVANATTVPSTNPSGGAVWYVEGGASKARGSSGTTTTFASANPHCPHCGSDFVHEWDNPARWGYLAVCMNCHVDGINSHTRTRGAWNIDEGS